MIRAFIFLVLLAAVAAAAIWFADQPGAVSIAWQGYQIDTSVAVLAVAVAIVALVVALVYRFWRFLVRGPKVLKQRHHDRRRRRGYEALTKGMVAVAAGDAAEAQRQSHRAEVLLNEPPLTLLLSAQAAQLAGDATAARRYFDAMLERPEMEFLGLRGLLNEAKRDGDIDSALAAARRAYQLRPRAEWVLTSLFDLEVRAGEWDRAEQVLRECGRRHVYKDAELARRRAIVLYEQGRARAGGDGDKLLRKARDADRAFLPAALALAEREIAAGRDRQASRVIEDSWRVLPTAEAGALYLKAGGDGDPLKQLKRIEKLAATNPDHAESHLALARAAMAAKLWGQARSHLSKAAETAPTVSAFRLLAELEEAEHGDSEKARYWLARAADAVGDPAWICDHCGTVAGGWQALCGHCESFDSLHWRSPARMAAISAGPPPKALPVPTPPAAAGGDGAGDGEDASGDDSDGDGVAVDDGAEAEVRPAADDDQADQRPASA
ncbi:MAG: heme biosynthesis protein HemY [Alphaproteobacteria bacterium]|nr:heme biosynthesis protein HemY [Alphaproteobacteria bacterium]